MSSAALRRLASALFVLGVCACGGDGSSSANEGDGSQSDQFANAASGASNGTGGRTGAAGNNSSTDGGSSAAAGRGSDGGASDGGATGASGSDGAVDAGVESTDSGTPDGGPSGEPMGTQPLGAVCANDGHCSQAMGEAVCCVNSCELVADCPDSPGYLPCMTGADCERWGGGKICCEAGTDRFCTKQSACMGERIP